MAKGSAFVWDDSFSAAQDLSSHQYKVMKLSGKDQVDLVASATGRSFGILLNHPKSGEAADVRILGKSPAQVDGNAGAIVAGDYLGPDANSRLVKKSTPDNSVVAISNGGSTVLGDIIEVFLVPIGWFRTVA